LAFDTVEQLNRWRFTPLNNSIRTADEFSTKLPVTDLNIAPLWCADSNLHRFKMGHFKSSPVEMRKNVKNNIKIFIIILIQIHHHGYGCSLYSNNTTTKFFA